MPRYRWSLPFIAYKISRRAPHNYRRCDRLFYRLLVPRAHRQHCRGGHRPIRFTGWLIVVSGGTV